MIAGVKSRAFERWTRNPQSVPTRRRDVRPSPSRRLLVLGGVSLILLSLVWVLVDSQVVGNAVSRTDTAAMTPKNQTLRLTVPAMRRVDHIPVYNAAAGNEQKLNASAIHLEGTGFPWQKEANVYIAGHRLGYPRTGSFLVFYDLHRLRRGDRVVLEDASGGRYVYKVFDKLIAAPNDLSVTEPLPGKNIVSLQACTLPNYTGRLIVQAELKRSEVEPKRAGLSASGDPSP
jgi:sortase A